MPLLGETIAADNDILKAFGGKGANQAIACARLCQGLPIQVQMLGQVGKDSEGSAYLQYLIENNIDSSLVSQLDNVATGQAYILCQNKDNSIIIVGGANQQYADTIPPAWESAISTANILLMQREIPEHINVAASRIAKSCGVITILDMGGNDAPLTHELLEHIDYVSPNQTELVRIVKSIKANHLTESESQMAKELAEGDPRKTGFDFINILREFPEMKVLFKQGEAGSTLMHLTSIGELQGMRVPAQNFDDFKYHELVDTTGAGDAYTGAFAVGLLQYKGDENCEKKAMQLATNAAFLTISRLGAAPAMPTRAEINETFID